MAMIDNNDPNLGWTKTRLAVTLMMWDYQTRVEVGVTGNVTGFDLFEAALANLGDEMAAGDEPVVFLRRPSQVEGVSEDEVLEVDLCDDGKDVEDSLREMVVAIEVIERVAAPGGWRDAHA